MRPRRCHPEVADLSGAVFWLESREYLCSGDRCDASEQEKALATRNVGILSEKDSGESGAVYASASIRPPVKLIKFYLQLLAGTI